MLLDSLHMIAKMKGWDEHSIAVAGLASSLHAGTPKHTHDIY